MHGMSLKLGVLCCLGAAQIYAADPTFLRRRIPDIQPKASDLSTSTAHYRAVFGAGDADARQLKGIARYGELTVDAGGSSETVSYPAGRADLLHPGWFGRAAIRRPRTSGKEERFRLSSGGCDGMANHSGGPVRLLVMGFKIPAGAKGARTAGGPDCQCR
jgi:hypothetical protein